VRLVDTIFDLEVFKIRFAQCFVFFLRKRAVSVSVVPIGLFVLEPGSFGTAAGGATATGKGIMAEVIVRVVIHTSEVSLYGLLLGEEGNFLSNYSFSGYPPKPGQLVVDPVI
jgi:hypothetical protein